MCSACDGDTPHGEADGTAPSERTPSDAAALTRRGLLLGGLSLAVAACLRGQPRPGVGTGMWYAAQPGDTLSSLSRRSGLAVDLIAEVNGLNAPQLRPGTRLWLPGVRGLAADPLAARPPDVRPPQAPAAPRSPSPSDGYELVPRRAWTDQPIGPNHEMMNGVERITIHHTDEHGDMAGMPDTEVLRKIERYHRETRRWAAIAYHYLVGKDGRVYEGRPAQFQGAHCGDNTHNLGISVIGDCHHNLPLPRQLSALKAFLDDQRKRHDVPLRRVYGHRELKPTICPGDRLQAWVLAYSGRA